MGGTKNLLKNNKNNIWTGKSKILLNYIKQDRY
jgi:hypothetical protein